jgi:hypothetical protein
MRGGRSLLILLVVALGLGAYIYFVEAKRDPGDAEKKAKVFTVDASKIEEIEVHAASGDVTTLKKSGDTWAIVSPIAAGADESTVTAITDALAAMDVEKVLDENATALGQYGLEPPRFSVAFRAAGDPTRHRIAIGSKTPTGSDLYARIEGQNRLFLTPTQYDDTLNRTTFDLRDKRVLAFSRDAVDALTIAEKGAPEIALTRKDSNWTMTAPITTRADFSPVDGIVGRLDAVRMQAIVSEGSEPTPAQLKSYGLDAPQIVATLGSGSSKATLAIGSKKDANAVYARDLSRPIIFTVEPALVTDLSKKPDDLRIKDVFEFKSFNATGLDVTHGATAVSFSRTKPAGGDASAADTWTQTKPVAKAANQTALTDLMNTLSSMRIDRFVTSTPPAGDDLVIVAHTGEGAAAEEHVTLRKVGTTVYAIRPGEPGGGVAAAADFDKAITQLQTLTSAK